MSAYPLSAYTRDVISAKEFGVRPGPDITANLQAAINAAIAAGKTLELPAGTLDYSGLITGGCSMIGQGAETNLRHIGAGGQNSRINIVSASRLMIAGLRMSTANQAGAFTTEAEISLRFTSCTDMMIAWLWFEQVAGAALFRSCVGVQANQISLRNLFKDGLHTTGGSTDVNITNVVCTDGGDDVVPVVSYQSDAAPCSRVNISNIVVNGTKAARGVAVVGGEDISISNVVVNNSYAAGLYIASEVSYSTRAAKRINANSIKLIGCGKSTPGTHAGLTLTGSSGIRNDAITLRDIYIGGAEWRGLNANYTDNIRIDGLLIEDNAGGSGAEFANCANPELRRVDLRRTQSHGMYFANSCTGRILIDGCDLTDINTSAGASNDGVQIQSGATADEIVLNNFRLLSAANTLDRFIENNNPGKTKWGWYQRAQGLTHGVVHGLVTTSLTVTASPYVYQNVSGEPQRLNVVGGTVSEIAVSDSNAAPTFSATGRTSGYFILRPNQRARITYSALPGAATTPVSLR